MSIVHAAVKVNRKSENDTVSLDKALKRLKSIIDNEGIMDIVRAKRAFENPKQKKERKLAQRLRALKAKKNKKQLKH